MNFTCGNLLIEILTYYLRQRNYTKLRITNAVIDMNNFALLKNSKEQIR